LDYITEDLKRWEDYTALGGPNLWTFTRETPNRFAEISGDRFLVMIDEFQYLNKHIRKPKAQIGAGRQNRCGQQAARRAQ